MRVSPPTFPIARILLQEYSEDSAGQPYIYYSIYQNISYFQFFFTADL